MAALSSNVACSASLRLNLHSCKTNRQKGNFKALKLRERKLCRSRHVTSYLCSSFRSSPANFVSPTRLPASTFSPQRIRPIFWNGRRSVTYERTNERTNELVIAGAATGTDVCRYCGASSSLSRAAVRDAWRHRYSALGPRASLDGLRSVNENWLKKCRTGHRRITPRYCGLTDGRRKSRVE